MSDSNSATPTPSYNPSDMDGNGDSEDTTGAFGQCPDCGDVVVSQSRHSCATDDDAGYIPREEREHLADADDRDADRRVILPTGTASTRYHEIDQADAEARCWIGPDPDAADASVEAQHEAARRGYAPCGACRVAENSDDE